MRGAREKFEEGAGFPSLAPNLLSPPTAKFVIQAGGNDLHVAIVSRDYIACENVAGVP